MKRGSFLFSFFIKYFQYRLKDRLFVEMHLHELTGLVGFAGQDVDVLVVYRERIVLIHENGSEIRHTADLKVGARIVAGDPVQFGDLRKIGLNLGKRFRGERFRVLYL